MYRALLIFVLCVSACLGCSEQSKSAGGTAPSNEYYSYASAKTASDTTKATAAAPADASSVDVVPAAQQIIYVANIDLVVQQFDPLERTIPQLVQQFGGYVADASVNRSSGKNRYGRWVARVPVEQFEPFLAKLDEFGIVESRKQSADDVTEEYVDLEARIANSTQLEQRILKLLESRSENIADTIKVEEELGRVRGEIERMQGRLRYLKNRTSLTTITINAREEATYHAAAAATLGARVQRGWARSVAELREAAERTVVSGAMLAPWLIVCSPLLIVGLVVWRRWRAQRKLAAN